MYTTVVEFLKIIWPIILIQVIFQIFCIVKLLNEGSRNLSKGLWVFIILILNILGPILFLLLGVKKEADYD